MRSILANFNHLSSEDNKKLHRNYLWASHGARSHTGRHYISGWSQAALSRRVDDGQYANQIGKLGTGLLGVVSDVARAVVLGAGASPALCDGAKQTTKRWYYYSGPATDPNELERCGVFAGGVGQDLADDIVRLLGLKDTGSIKLGKYADGESYVQVEENVRGKDVYLIVPTMSNDSVMETLLMISAMRRASSETITAIMPFFAYSRQDEKKASKRTTIGAADIALMLEEMGVDRVVSVDLHATQVQGFFSPTVPVDNLLATGVAAAYFVENVPELMRQMIPAGAPDGPQEKQGAQQQQAQQQAQAPQRVVIVAPHENNVLRAKHFQKTLINHLVMAALEEGVGLADGKPLAEPQIELATVVKMRDKRGELERHLIGDVDGALCIIVDDLLDTGVTVTEAADLLKSMNAGKVYAFATHGRFSGDCANTIVASKSLEWVVCTDTIPFQRFVSAAAMNSGKIQQLSLAPLIAEVIHRLHAQRSMRDLLGGQKEAD